MSRDASLPPPPRNDRPNDRWHCGRACEGTPCSLGPTPRGKCGATAPCHPTQLDGVWSCKRPATHGGCCQSGPHDDGRCSQTPRPCTPEPSWHHRRARWAAATCALVLIAVPLALLGPWRGVVLRPGELASPHAQILGTSLASSQCISCHEPNGLTRWIASTNQSSAALWNASTGLNASTGPNHATGYPDSHGERALSQSERCMACHRKDIPVAWATFAHSVATDALQREGGSRREAIDDVQCNVCHREHQGLLANLSEVSNARCQSCHQRQFESLESGHPSWGPWPHHDSGPIAFDHRSHAQKHFTAKQQSFDCNLCHPSNVEGQPALAVGFDTMCRQCHADPLTQSIDQGLALVRLPTLDASRLRQANPTLVWPEAATGANDGAIAPITQLLLAAEPETLKALDELPPGDLMQVAMGSQRQVDALATIAKALARLTDEIGVEGQPVINQRLERLGLMPIEVQLPPQLVGSASLAWFRADPATASASQHFREPFRGMIQPASANRSPSPTASPEASQAPSIADDDLLAPSTSSDDPLADLLPPSPSTNSGNGDALGAFAEGSQDQQNAERRRADPWQLTGRTMPAGGWYRDDLKMEIGYRFAGHGDKVMQQWIERCLAALHHSSPVVQRSAAAFLSSPAAQGCLACHQPAQSSASRIATAALRSPQFAVRWSASRGTAQLQWTKFSHTPHLRLAALQDCQHCHRIEPLQHSATELHDETRTVSGSREFAIVATQSCAQCHRSGAVSDRCTLCHRYHASEPGAFSTISTSAIAIPEPQR
jgi:hypothetical protein